eukprot:CAMPEP_0181539438 /NCGR_PEP_ID=MMETSP1110-20121109/76373_1 /TAXON_ID=174948 /ORGANISM="Symbiodinium sp., Strain CCMP421" /LENGTH=257 /DNA_ID=CAMNT_0023671053 /DNA_START=32 /DNA_END=802 /DNA_ORIENTATION=-
MMLARLAVALVLREGLSLRQDAFAGGKNGCDAVVGAMKREGLHFFAKCKCSGYEAVLTHECGDQAGERKFDLSRLPEEEAWGRKRIIPSCQCRATLPDGLGGRVVPWNAYYEAPRGREAPTAESTTSPAEPTAESTTSPPEPTAESTTSPPEPSLDMTAVCGRFSAVPRGGVFHKKGCKCRHESYLSLACGKGLGLRKFDPHNEEVQDPNCKCMMRGSKSGRGKSPDLEEPERHQMNGHSILRADPNSRALHLYLDA